MKIVIDINEKDYEYIKELGFNGYRDQTNRVVEAIANGIVIPKEHGDLIDRKALLNKPYEKGGFVEWYDEIKHAPTIIEADKGE